MFYIPMAFMMVVTLTSLALTVWAKIGLLAAGTVDAATVLQLVIGVLLMVFAVILAVKGLQDHLRQEAGRVEAGRASVRVA